MSAAHWLGPYNNADDALNELRKSVAKIIGEDPETWPDHGNAPLAIAATLALARRTNPAPAQEPVAVPEGALTERVAKLLWERFAPAHHMEWEGETHKAEYRSVAGDVLTMLAAPVSPPAGEG